MTAVAPIDRVRLARILGMLGSDHPGERAAAGLKATQALKAAGLTWDQVLQPTAVTVLTMRPQASQSPSSDTRADAQFCLKHCEHVTDWERTFISSVVRRSCLSAKQVSTLRQIADSLRARGFV